jgi:hypothetical protein
MPSMHNNLKGSPTPTAQPNFISYYYSYSARRDFLRHWSYGHRHGISCWIFFLPRPRRLTRTDRATMYDKPTSGTQAIYKSSLARQDKYTSVPRSCYLLFYGPEIPVKRAHCFAVILYVFFVILAKSLFSIYTNNPTKTS